MSVKEQYRKYSLITIILGLGLLLFLKMTPFMGGILGACTIYIMVRDQMLYLTQKKKIRKSVTAIILLIEAILCFLVPLSLAVWLLISKLHRQCRHRHFCRHNYQPCRLDSPEDRI